MRLCRTPRAPPTQFAATTSKHRLSGVGLGENGPLPSPSPQGGVQVPADVNHVSPSASYGTTRSSFDAEGRLTKVTEPGGKTIHYEYDAVTGQHRRTWTAATATSTNPLSDTRYAHDAFGRLETVKVHERFDTPLASPETTRYGYDARFPTKQSADLEK